VLGGFGTVDLPVVKLLEDVLEKGAGQAFGQLFFSQCRMDPDCPLVEGLGRPPGGARRRETADHGTVDKAKKPCAF
jgi:hypothetical protein